jgi:hypothetical protein
LNNAHEAFHGVVRPIYDILIKEMGISPGKIILLSESAIIDNEVKKISAEYNLPRIKVKWHRVFEMASKRTLRSISCTSPIIDTLTSKQYNKKFLNLNRRWRLHRPTFVALLEINDMLTEGYVSLAKADDGKDWNTFFDEMSWMFRNKPSFVSTLNHNMERIKSIPPMTLDKSDMSINYAATHDSETNYYYQNTYFSIVSETTFFKELGEGVFLSEKIFRPIMNKHPFLLLSRPHTLTKLRQIGYKTFDTIIDESYDQEEDDIKRMMMVLKETKRLCDLTDNELDFFLAEAREITKFNYFTLLFKPFFTTDII